MESANDSCQFWERISSHVGNEDKNTIIRYRFGGGRLKVAEICFGVSRPVDSDDEDDPELKEGDIVVGHSWVQELLAMPGNVASEFVARSPINLEPGSSKSFDLITISSDSSCAYSKQKDWYTHMPH